MKRIIFTLIALLLFATTMSQTLKEDKTDEFTKTRIKRTSYETFARSSKLYIYARTSLLDTLKFLDIKVMLGGKVFNIREGDKLMLKLDNDTIVTLSNIKAQISCRGCGATGLMGSNVEGVATSYGLLPDVINKLERYSVKKVRLYTSNGYVEEEAIEKSLDLLKKCLYLIK